MANRNQVAITEQTIYDLCYWISSNFDVDEVKLERLIQECKFLEIASLANQSWLLAAFKHNIKKKGAWDKLPSQYQDYLEDVTDVYKKRAADLVEEIENVIPCLNEIGVTPIVLKGGASLITGASDPYYIRYMNDIDILVRPEQLGTATSQMIEHGYVMEDETYDIEEYLHHHQSPLKKANSLCYVELHRWHFKKTLLSILPWEDVWLSAKAVSNEKNDQVKVGSATHQVIINIVHSELSDRGYFEEDIQLFQLFSLYQLVNFYQSEIDWQEIFTRFEKVGVENVLHARMYALAELFGCELLQVRSELVQAKNKKHFLRCLSNCTKNQSGVRLSAIVAGQLSEYNRLSIKAHYGVDSFWLVFCTRCNILKSQLKKLFNKDYLKKFIQANFK